MMKRRMALSLGLAAAVGPFEPTGRLAHASTYPDRPLRIIVPFAPGGVTDMVGRTMAQGLTTRLGQTVVVENRAGASGVPGAELAARATPDGYTLLLGNISTLAINAAVFQKLPYDPQASFDPISMVARQPLLVCVNPQLPVRTVVDLVELARSKPNSLNFGSAGASLQLATEAFNQAAGLRMTHVPYRGSSPAMADLIAGHIDVLFDAFSSLHPFVQEGTVRALAITSAQRSPLAPELATLAELGFPQVDVTSWQAIVVPAGTPADLRSLLHTATREVLATPEVRMQLTRQGVEASASTPDELARYAAEEMRRWKLVAETAGVRPT